MRATALLALALASAGAPVLAQPASPVPAVVTTTSAFINITPKRITFDRSRRIGTVFLVNQGREPVTVDIALIDRVMLPDGQIFAADDAAQREDGRAIAAELKSAKDLLQLSPRRVTLQPNRPQTVRVRLASLPDAAAGERRSHLTITTLPPRDTGATPEEAANPAAGGTLSFQITAVYGLSIPVIVRPAEPDVSARLDGARVEFVDASREGGAPRRTAVVALDLVRGGASSVYGNFEVRVIGEAKGAEPLGLARGVAVYPEVARRAVRIPLSRAPAPGEKLEVTFTDDDTSPGKVLAKAAL